ncbi:chemotaxis protein CheA [Burkholderia multivorans]|uniref:chemotaxis protein CheA n=1 Tax=Burkholderia multivorans TaxID=87883 RepID=UPI00285B34FA|nr:chemotaxis protein CheA [Burkholderia multivorans]MDR9096149.1 Chemotaxis protein CheA [Burkholderia multivorans]MDR9119922.1 Chemotaxis protein CheA [Burkholderia multivorans]MDR9160189.1 Chemotaxis protein CheA [Burkholderia multivorans]MDR9166744.1 Chemotaxis protein CheA [Burkholderia multivorans]MDR9253223.1 Chemotaxis protein CheA [Burkholderia multivorans]
MNPLLEQFILEARDFLQAIGEKLIALEDTPDSVELMTELFRAVHTLKGNSGLFEFPEMTRVLHAGEDLMDTVRDGRVPYSQTLADRLLDAMDFVGLLLDEIEQRGSIAPARAESAAELAHALRALIPAATRETEASDPDSDIALAAPGDIPLPALAGIPESRRLAAFRAAAGGVPLFLIAYRPEEESFFKGEDPFYQARQTPGSVWGSVSVRAPWPPLVELDCYRCVLDFHLLCAAPRAEIDEHFRYIPEQVHVAPVSPLALIIPQGHPNGGPVYGDFVAEAQDLLAQDDLSGLEAAAWALLELSAPQLWLSSALRGLLALIEAMPAEREAMRRLILSLQTQTPPDFGDVKATVEAGAAQAPSSTPLLAKGPAATLSEADRERLAAILSAQAQILALPDEGGNLAGRLRACAATLAACLANLGEAADEVEEALAATLEAGNSRPLAAWLAAFREGFAPVAAASAPSLPQAATQAAAPHATVSPAPASTAAAASPAARRAEPTESADSGVKFGRRAEDSQISKVLKVDQAKVDRLMNLIGEMVVAKNALPYLANRAENQFGVRELSREIKAQYAVINRIAEEMQDAIMQVRMMPVSFIFQRFPRLVRDISRKLGKEVELILEGEETEADKTIVEALADPLIHIVRNSLDHGIESPEARSAAGKSATGRLVIRAVQESDRVVIEVADDGRGIDPAVIKRKAYEKGLIDEARLGTLSDREAINLIFAPGFSTAETVSDLSGRGVGMDVVRSAIEKVGGTVELHSEVGRGTRLKLSLPLSMAVTNVMIVESDRQIFGVPMEHIIETVRVPETDIRLIKRQKTTVLRGRIVPLFALNDLLGIAARPVVNEENEFAVLVVRVGQDQVGLLVDGFREVVDVILKPLPGALGNLACYAGSALLGDGSVLMVLNPKELF